MVMLVTVGIREISEAVDAIVSHDDLRRLGLKDDETLAHPLGELEVKPHTRRLCCACLRRTNDQHEKSSEHYHPCKKDSAFSLV
jgi:hypothetical protein